MTEEEKAEIDAMSREELCSLWRFARIGDAFWLGERGAYASNRLAELGGFCPEISKRIGWEAS